MSLELDRVLRLDGAQNLRDVGGYATVDRRQTRWRVLYRSDCLDRIDAEGQQWLIRAGLRTIIDLRHNGEVAKAPNVFATSPQVRYRRVPIWDEPVPDTQEPDTQVPDTPAPDIDSGYLRELDERGSRLADVVEEIVAPDGTPVLIHCAAGKDRTGLVIGLLLAAVGVPRATIAEDYALSAVCLGPEYLVASRRMVEQQGLDWERWAHLFHTPPERMLRTLEYVDTAFGGIESYFIQHGLNAGRLDVLRERLTEPMPKLD